VDRFTPFYVLGEDDSQGFMAGPMPFDRPFKHGFSASDEHEIRRPVRPGDFITNTTTVGDMFEKRGRPGIGHMLFMRFDKTYRNQRNEIVSICRWTSVGYEGPTDGESEPTQPPPTAATSSSAERATAAADRKEQWTTPTYFEDAGEGFELAPVKMLQTQKRFIRWAQASNDLSEIHYDHKIMEDRGMPDVVGQGALTTGYIASLLSDWYTPGGFLKKLGVQYRHYTIPGDVVTCKGVVTSTSQQDGENLVNLDVWAENQDERKVTVGQAVVSLPSHR
jgi:acyl dehydratase